VTAKPREVQTSFAEWINKCVCYIVLESALFCFSFNFSFLTQCRPLSVSMGNAIKYLKLQITHTPPDMAEDQVHRKLYAGSSYM